MDVEHVEVGLWMNMHSLANMKLGKLKQGNLRKFDNA